MKNKILCTIALIALTLSITSCYSSRRSRTGCPMNTGKVAPVTPVEKQAA